MRVSWTCVVDSNTMELIVANVSGHQFDIEVALEQQFGALPLPFTGMDKSTSAVCEFYPKGNCARGAACPFRHVRSDRSVVCKHWLRGLCKKGDQCEFLHEFDMTKMPECYFYSRFNACHNKECPFLHIDPESKMKDCPWYDRGFCRHGPLCRHRHVRRVLCLNYLAGFCAEGPNCKQMHPRFELPAAPENTASKDIAPKQKSTITCHFCGEQGHKAMFCSKANNEHDGQRGSLSRGQHQEHHIESHHNSNMPYRDKFQGSRYNDRSGGEDRPRRDGPKILKPLDEVTCFKCGCKGHYANKCPKGHLAFLSHNAGTMDHGYQR
ncbi:Hypothetical predicted protein [Cloeon dipterum]|uniref:Cleavage and polyadenylation specificity factor subunit 4 n=1 Tax=Cloeon dipterum TaxID=197152 RepID=A0A8S1D7R0_9INSE|nr:Hypothetical predicted protein [Cloeon dipterum]